MECLPARSWEYEAIGGQRLGLASGWLEKAAKYVQQTKKGMMVNYLSINLLLFLQSLALPSRRDRLTYASSVLWFISSVFVNVFKFNADRHLMMYSHTM